MTNDVFIWILNRGVELGAIVLLLLPLRFILKRTAPKIFSYMLWCIIPISIIYNLFTLFMPKLSYYVIVFESGMPAISLNKTAGIICKVILIIGFALILLYEIGSYLSLRRCLIGSIRLRGNIYLAARIKEPFTMGVFSPEIYLPSSLDEKFYEYIIAHEEVHIARKDVLMRCIGSVLRIVFWFQPLMWVAYHLFINDMEDACDETALRKCSMEYRIQYAEALVEVSYQAGKARNVAIGYGSGEIKKRIKQVLEYKKPKRIVIISASVVCITFICFSIPMSWKVPRLIQVESEEGKNTEVGSSVREYGPTEEITLTDE